MTRKTKLANYPDNHPSWVTHQYVADTIMYGLLNLVKIGLGCDSPGYKETLDNESASSLTTSVATKEEINACFICETPLTWIDAKSPQYYYFNFSDIDNSVNTADFESNGGEVVLICGDWKWITDNRNRSGWQSDKYGSIVRFRLRVSTDKLPTISMTYMRSHDTFGDLRVTFQAVSRQESSAPIPAFGCKDIDKFEVMDDETDDEAEEKTTLVPSLSLDGSLPKFSLWETTVFPPELDDSDVNGQPAWNLLNQTVLSRILAAGSSDDAVVEYVDLYVINTNKERSRIKIQVVTSC
jgi:hypothetical protein